MMRGTNDSGQSNFDFLVGSAIFLMAFIYVIASVPGLFVPYQAGAVDLSSVAYKTGAVLVEDPGWYTWKSGTDVYGDPGWENHRDQVSRIGLADDRTSPNVLSVNKIQALSTIDNYSLVRDKIGLNGTITYEYSLSLNMTNGLSGKKVPLLNLSGAEESNNVEYLERNVLVDTGKQLFVDCGKPTSVVASNSAILRVGLANRTVTDEDNVTVRIYNTTHNQSVTIQSVNFAYDTVAIPTIPLILNKHYAVYKNGEQVLSLPFTFICNDTVNDTVEIVIYHSAFTELYDPINNKTIQGIGVKATTGTTPFPGTFIDYSDDPDFMLQRVCYPGLFKIKVWSYEF